MYRCAKARKCTNCEGGSILQNEIMSDAFGSGGSSSNLPFKFELFANPELQVESTGPMWSSCFVEM